MKKIGLAFTAFYSLFTMLYGTAGNNSIYILSSGIPNRDPAPQQLPDTRTAWHRLCCCSINNSLNDDFLTDVETVHKILTYMRDIQTETSPNYLRELYLLCQNSLYKQSRHYLFFHTNLLTNQGEVKPKWRELILSMLRRPIATESPQDFYFKQAVIDFAERYPIMLQILTAKKDATTRSDILDRLCTQYALTKDMYKITREEANKIIQTVAAMLATPTIGTTLKLASLEEFIAFATNDSTSPLSVVIPGLQTLDCISLEDNPTIKNVLAKK